MRERLIELIADARNNYYDFSDEMHEKGMPVGESSEEYIADYLLANGGIILPCKVGDTVYQYSKVFTKCTVYEYKPRYIEDSNCIGCCARCDSESYDFLYTGTVANFYYNEKGVFVQVKWKEKWDSSFYEIGKTVFLTQEEAEQALKGGASDEQM